MSETIEDPIHRTRYSFRREGENLIVDTWLGAGGELPKHYHPVQVENWQVVEGRVKFHLDGTDRVIGPEDGVMNVKPGMRHALKAIDPGEVHLRCEVIPALGLEDFLTESSEAARRGLFRSGGIPASLEGARWAADFIKRHRAETVMTFPPQLAQRAMIALFAGRSG